MAGAAVAARVAVLSVGLARTVAHPGVAASFELLRASLLHDGHVVKTFLYVYSPRSGGEDSDPEIMVGNAWKTVIDRYYRPARAWVVSFELPCNRRCRTVPCPNGRPHYFLQQFFKVKLAWDAVMAWEQDEGMHFDWFVKVRPDLLWLETLPPLSIFSMPGDITSGNSVFVPYGVMTERRKNFQYNDHVLVCPRVLCVPYFNDVVSQYERCDENALMRMQYPPQIHLFNRTCVAGRGCYRKTRLFKIAYTIAREALPECGRLVVETNLRAHMSECMFARKYWRDHERVQIWFNNQVQALEGTKAASGREPSRLRRLAHARLLPPNGTLGASRP